ncbi:sulfatase/phosphatase domain-containing protein [Neotamlana sedimentorum]|uniref:sulfatase/phosphatase domain-containing protein n=1 Tax=Neotamlana sedimentorum TaxID=1435349 RepID=UPI0006999C07
MRWPSESPAGIVDKTTELVTVDLLPTFLELAGVTFPDNYKPDGVSILSAIKGKAFKRDKPIYWDWRFSNNRTDFWPSAGIQEANWKLLTNSELGRTELYNINSDWSEQMDLSNKHPEKVKELLNKIKTFEETLPTAPAENCFSKERANLFLRKE